jgi:hypothetical protein
MKEILERHGFDPKDARKLQAEGIGPHELEDRARRPAEGIGGLTYTHRLRKREAARFFRRSGGACEEKLREANRVIDVYKRAGLHVQGARFVPDVVTKAKAADKKYGYFRPDDQFTIEAIHLSEEQRKKLTDRIFDKADDPYVSMSMGKLLVAPSRQSYFGDELFVAIKEALKLPYRFEASGNRFVIL